VVVSFNCPFCDCFFLTEHDLALHLKAFSDIGVAHKDAVKRLHEFVEEFGSDCCNDNFTKVEFRYPEQIVADFEFIIRASCGLFSRGKKAKRVR
jgi:hypothetical protein